MDARQAIVGLLPWDLSCLENKKNSISTDRDGVGERARITKSGGESLLPLSLALLRNHTFISKAARAAAAGSGIRGDSGVLDHLLLCSGVPVRATWSLGPSLPACAVLLAQDVIVASAPVLNKQ